MRHGPAGRRLRNRGGNNPRGNGGGGNQNNRNKVFDSNGPDVRIRGTAHQIQEKYAVLAKDAASAGDQVLAESYLQHAEHYQRIINSWMEQSSNYHHHADEADDGFRADRRFDMPVRQNQEIQGNVRPQDDLDLPSSILGAPVSQNTKTPELADA